MNVGTEAMEKGGNGRQPDDRSDVVTLASLAMSPRWVAWQTEERGSSGKPTKIPYAPIGGKARANDPQTWGSREAAEARAAVLAKPFGVGGVGLQLGDHDGLTIGGIDLDTCRAVGAMEPWAEAVIARFHSYAEVSPSGAGAKVLFTFDPAELPTLRRLMGTEHGKQWKRKSGGDHPPAIELYLGNRYFAVTDQRLDTAPPELRRIPRGDLEWLILTAGPEFASGDTVSANERSHSNKRKITGAGDGSRSALAFKMAADVKRECGSYEAFKAKLRTNPDALGWLEEKGRANGERELRRAWDRAGQAVTDDVLLTEHGAALAFMRRQQNKLRYCHDTGAWFIWTGTYWRQDRTHAAFSFARDLVATANRDAEFKTQAITGRAAFATGVEKFAQRDPVLAVSNEDWDQDPFLLATPGGTVDLRTGVLRAAVPDDMMTRITAVAPASAGTECPVWCAFLLQATKGDRQLIDFLKRWFGYCLTGDTREHALLFGHGPGGNGKSVLLNTTVRIMGDYAVIAAMDTFTASHGDKHPTDLAMLRGARMVCASETEEGQAWAESRIKQMTGGDRITARFMRQDFFSYLPQFKRKRSHQALRIS